MAPKRRRVVGIMKSTKKVVRETVEVAVVERDTQESTQEDLQEPENVDDVPLRPLGSQGDVDAESEDLDVPLKESSRSVPVEIVVEEPDRGVDARKVGVQEQTKPSREEERKDDQNTCEEVAHAEPSKNDQTSSGVSQEESPLMAPPSDQSLKKTEATKEAEETKRKDRTQEGKRKRKRKSGTTTVGHEGYKRYVYRVLKQVHPELRISSMAMTVINSLMNDMFERIADEGAKLSRYTQRMTLSSREIQDAVKLVLPGELGKHAIAEGSKAISNYISYETKK